MPRPSEGIKVEQNNWLIQEIAYKFKLSSHVKLTTFLEFYKPNVCGEDL